LWVRGGPARIAAARAEWRRRRGIKALTEGLAAIAAGDAKQARQLARRAEALLDEPALTLMLSAQAAELAGDTGLARTQFEAMLARPETEFLGVRGLLAEAERSGDRDRALGLARRAFKAAPDSPTAAKALFALEAETGHWAEADALLRTRAATAAFAPAEARKFATIVRYERAVDAEARGLPEAAFELARQVHKLSPSFVPGALVYARVATAQGRSDVARAAIRVTWRRLPHPSLVDALTAVAPAEAPPRLLKRIEKLIVYNPDHPESRLALAAAALAAGEPDRARAALAPLAAEGAAPDARVCLAMADIERAAGNVEPAALWRTRAANAPTHPGFPCTACGARHARFRSICQSCGAFGSLEAFAADPAGAAPVGLLARLLGPAARAPVATLPAPPAFS
jgi:HemY protein